MRRFLRAGVAVALAAVGLVWTSGPLEAAPGDPLTVVPCSTPVTSPEVTVPVVGGVGASDNCAEMHRTLVFQGVALIDNGVNFSGVGGTSPESHSTTLPAGEETMGGTYSFSGLCVLVDWSENHEGAVGAPVVSDCGFGVDPNTNLADTTGFYTRPSYQAKDGANAGTSHPDNGGGSRILNDAGHCVEHGDGIREDTSGGSDQFCAGVADGLDTGVGPYTGLDFAPDDQASCTDSDGRGVSTFRADLTDGRSEEWSAEYTWNNSLNNLRGPLWKGSQSSRPASPDLFFDAKIQAQAWPAAADPLDSTAAGCVQKSLTALQNPNSYSGTNLTGLNDILIVGTASWKVQAPEVKVLT